MRTKAIKVTLASQVAVIWLDRPGGRNAIDGPMAEELDATLATLETDVAVRAVVLAGQGPAVCAGGDVRWMKRMSGSSLAVIYQGRPRDGALAQPARQTTKADCGSGSWCGLRGWSGPYRRM